MKNKSMFKWVGKAIESFTPLNTCREEIWHKVLHMHNLQMPTTPEEEVMGSELRRWCKFYRDKGHHTDDRYMRDTLRNIWREIPPTQRRDIIHVGERVSEVLGQKRPKKHPNERQVKQHDTHSIPGGFVRAVRPTPPVKDMYVNSWV